MDGLRDPAPAELILSPDRRPPEMILGPDRRPPEMILGPDRRPPELFSRLFRRQPWWEPVPSGLVLRPPGRDDRRPAGPSRLVVVHPGWLHWRPRPAAVH